VEQPAGTSASAAEELNTRDHRENGRQDEPPAHGHRGVAEPGHDHQRDYVDNQQYNQGVRHSRVRTLSLAYRVICRHLFSVGLGYTPTRRQVAGADRDRLRGSAQSLVDT